MTILDLLNKANEVYPDGFLSMYYDQDNGEEKPDDGADGLALFIVREIHSLCSGTNQDGHLSTDRIEEVAKGLGKAAFELMAVAEHITNLSCESPTESEIIS